jgi:hypothetical protein
MKQCPKCRRLFVDGNLRFCRSDGERLVGRGLPADETATIQFTTGQLKYRLLEAAKRHKKQN